LTKNSIQQINAQKIALKNQLDHVHKKLNSTFSYIEKTAKNAEATIFEKIKGFFLPFFIGAVGLILFIFLMWLLVCCLFRTIKRKIANTNPRPFHRPQRSSRTDVL
jgi:hypothetical protein